MNVAVVIPVYKNFDENEYIALKQCCMVLKRYKIFLVCPEGYNSKKYHSLWENFGLVLNEERFDNVFFKNIEGYNKLLLSKEFYLRFSKYDYILIYQPDAYVFEDELNEWCLKSYDYVGAPFVGDYEEKEYHSNMQLCVGNGGFSLRRVKTFLDFFEGKNNVFNSSQIINHISFWEKPYTRWLVWLLMMFGWHNTPQWLSSHYKWNEDGFWSVLLSDSQYALKIPSAEEALEFAFERFPKEMYDKTKTMPFGCHAWRKYEFDEFWKYYIS